MWNFCRGVLTGTQRMQTWLESGWVVDPFPVQRGIFTRVPCSRFPEAHRYTRCSRKALRPSLPAEPRTVTQEVQENSAPKLLTFFYFHKSPYSRSVGC